MSIMASVIALGFLSLQPPVAAGSPPRLSTVSISNADYPPAAVRRREQGDVVIRFTVTARGGVADCTAEQSSGSAALDEQSCAIWRRRARYVPATGADGGAVAQAATQVFAWRIGAPCPPGGPGRICITASRRQPVMGRN